MGCDAAQLAGGKVRQISELYVHYLPSLHKQTVNILNSVDNNNILESSDALILLISEVSVLLCVFSLINKSLNHTHYH
jgi:hypothetical protein